ncbi:MAG: Hsp20/alpha crystallin family protein [Actinomycetota bacterium]
MRVGSFLNGRSDFDEVFERFFDEPRMRTWSGGYEVPTEIFHSDDRLTIRMDLPGVNPDDVDVSIQENVLVVNGTRRFPYEADQVRFLRRGTFYGEFTQRVTLGKGLDTENVVPGTTTEFWS